MHGNFSRDKNYKKSKNKMISMKNTITDEYSFNRLIGGFNMTEERSSEN